MWPAFVINLRDRPGRLGAFMAGARAAGYDVERFEAIDTRTEAGLRTWAEEIDDFAAMEATLRRGRRLTHAELTPGAVGCSLSHSFVASAALRRGIEGALIFEDDAKPPSLETIETMILEASSFDLLLLGWSGAAPDDRYGLVRPVGRFWGLHAYAATRTGLAAVASLNRPVRRQLDHVLGEAAAAGTLTIYGVNHQGDRVPQIARGSDVAFGPPPPRR